MNQPTGPLNKTQLAEAVADQLGCSLKDGYRVLDAVLDTITRTVVAGHDVTITNFGTFRATQAPARLAYNPQTGGRVPVAEKPVMRFRTSPRLREVVKAGDPTVAIRKRPSR